MKFLNNILIHFLFICMLLIPTTSNTDEFNSFDKVIDRIIFSEELGIDISKDILTMSQNRGKAIQALIDRIDIYEKVYFPIGFDYYQNPRSSYVSPNLIYKFIGLRSSYLIECILYSIHSNTVCGDTLDSMSLVNVLNCKYIYQIGLLRSDSIPDYRFTIDDMKDIKKIYQEWWDLNKDKPFVEIKNELENNNKPLSKSLYRWE